MITPKNHTHFLLPAALLALAFSVAGVNAAQPEVLIKWRRPAGAQARVAGNPAMAEAARLGAEYRRPVGLPGWDVAALPADADARAWVERVRNDPAVAHVELNHRYQALGTVNDRLFPRQYGLTQIGAPTAWDTTNGNPNIVVAILDTGINLNHPDLIPVLWTNTAEIPNNGLDDDSDGVVDDVRGADFVENDGDPTDDAGHGSHVAGIIAAAGNNTIGVAGVAYGCRVMPVRILSADNGALTTDIVRAFEYVRTQKTRGVNVRLINNSWGGHFPSLAIYEAILACTDAGILSVCAAGNDAEDTDILPSYPNAYDTPGVLAVAASDACDQVASFSNFGRRTVHLAAPGLGIYSAWGRGHSYELASGTSMATPHVTGAAALLLSRRPTLTLAELRAVLLNQVDAVPAWTNRTATGGRLNVAKAMAFLNTGASAPTNDPPNVALTNSPRRIVSRANNGRLGRDSSFTGYLGSSVSEDGRFVVFLSYATNLVAGDTGDFLDVFLRDTVSNTTVRVSQTLGGVGVNADCETPVISRDGNYVAFASAAGNLVSGDTDGARDVFVWTRATRALSLISFDPSAQAFTFDADSPSISDDGGYVAFAAEVDDGFGGSIRDIYVWRRSNNSVQIINFKSPSTFANDWSDSPSISGDGRYVAYHTWADNLVSGDGNNSADIHVFDRNNSSTTRVSRSTGNQQANRDSLYPILSGDGNFVAFYSLATNLGLTPTNNVAQNYLHNRSNGQLLQISLDAQGQPLRATNHVFDVSHDGRFVMLSTDSDQLPPFHGPRVERSFVWDRLTGIQNVTALNDGGVPADDVSYYPSISATGEWIVFCSWANNLVAPDGNNLIDVMEWRRGTQLGDLRIRAAGETNYVGTGIIHPLSPQRVNASAETNGVAKAEAQLINAGLATTTFQLRASVSPGWQLTALTTNNSDITSAILAGTQSSGSLAAGASYFIRLNLTRTNAFAETRGTVQLTCRVNGSTTNLDAVQAEATHSLNPPGLRLASRAANGDPALREAYGPTLDGNGSHLAFVSAADNLTANDENYSEDILVLDASTGALTLGSAAADGTRANARSLSPSLARAGGELAFESDANNLVGSDSNDVSDIFVKNLISGVVERASLGLVGNQLTRGSESPRLSQDGRYVLFQSIAPDAVFGDTNGCLDVFLRDRQSGALECVSLGSSGQFGNADSLALGLSPDARYVLFLSYASNLGFTDTNQFPDIFLRDRTLNTLELISGRTDFETSDGLGYGANLSDDGRFVVFRVDDSTLSPGGTNDLFLLDRQTGTRVPLLASAFGLPAGQQLEAARISPGGSFLALTAGGDCGATNGSQVFLAPRAGGVGRNLSALRNGTAGTQDSYGPVFSGDGRRLALASVATNLLGEPWFAAGQLFFDDTGILNPDAALARATNGSWRGGGEVGTNQSTLEQPLAFNSPRDFFLRVTDFSGHGGAVTVTGPTGNVTDWAVRYFADSSGGLEVTASLPGGWTYNPGTNVLDLRLRVRVTILTTNAPAAFVINVRSADFPALQENIVVPLAQDFDNDGLADAWEKSYFTNLTAAGANSDFDGDGQTDRQEYLAGTDPKNPASVLRLNVQSLGANAAMLYLPVTHTNRYYRLEASPAMGGVFSSRAAEQRGTGGLLLLPDTPPISPTNGFYRVRAELP